MTVHFPAVHTLLLGLSFHVAATAEQATQSHAPAASDATVLPSVRVQGANAQESATGPVQGFVARRATSATKTDTAIIETPQSISVITRDQMDAQNVQSVSDALRYTAGVMAEANGPDPRADVATIRGFSAGNRSSFRDGLRDDAFGGQGGVVIEPYGLERIEVLRGPASVLYGQGDAGGVINLVTKRPTRTPLHQMELQVGSYDRRQATFDLSDAIASAPQWSYRLTGLVRDAGTQINHVSDDRTYIAPALIWQPSDDTSLTLLVNYQKNRRGQGYQALPRIGTLVPGVDGRIPTNRFVGEPGFDRFDQERTSAGYAFEHRIDDAWTVRQNVRVMTQSTLVNTIYEAGLQDDGVTIARFGSKGRERVRNLVLDNQLQWKSATPGFEQTVLLGLDVQRLRSVSGTQYAAFPTLDVDDPVYGQPLPLSRDAPPDDTRETLTQTGLYAQDQIKVADHVAWTISGRYDTTRSDVVDIASNDGQPEHDHAYTGRTGIVYLFDSGWAPYAGYATSFTPIVDVDFEGSRFKPETGRQVEAGVRYQPKNQSVSFLASVYDLRRQNVLTGDVLHPDFSVQRGEVRSRGIELEAKASLLDDLDLIAAYAYNNLKVTRSTGDDLGKTPDTSPKHVASLWAGWRVPAVPGLKLSGGVRGTSSSFGDEVETIVVPGHTLLDAAVEFDLGRMSSNVGDWRLAFNVSNLTDKIYIATCGYYADGCKYGYRRSAAATLTYRW